MSPELPPELVRLGVVRRGDDVCWTDGPTRLAVAQAIGALPAGTRLRRTLSNRAIAAAVILRRLAFRTVGFEVAVGQALRGALPPVGPEVPILGGTPQQDALAWRFAPTLARLAGRRPTAGVWQEHHVERRAAELDVVLQVTTVEGLRRHAAEPVLAAGRAGRTSEPPSVTIRVPRGGTEVAVVVMGVGEHGHHDPDRVGVRVSWRADDLPPAAVTAWLRSRLPEPLARLRPDRVDLVPRWSVLAIGRAIIAYELVTGRRLADPTGHVHWMGHWRFRDVARLSDATAADRAGFGEVLEQVHTAGALPGVDRMRLTRQAEVLLALADVGAASDEVSGWEVRRTAALLGREYELVGRDGLDALLPEASVATGGWR